MEVEVRDAGGGKSKVARPPVERVRRVDAGGAVGGGRHDTQAGRHATYM